MVVEAERGGVWLALYEVLPEPQLAIDYEVANWFTAAHPNSPFQRNLIVARVTPQARYALLDNRFTARKPSGETEQSVLNAAQLEQTLAGVFGLPVESEWRPVIDRAVAGPSRQIPSPFHGNGTRV